MSPKGKKILLIGGGGLLAYELLGGKLAEKIRGGVDKSLPTVNFAGFKLTGLGGTLLLKITNNAPVGASLDSVAGDIEDNETRIATVSYQGPAPIGAGQTVTIPLIIAVDPTTAIPDAINNAKQVIDDGTSLFNSFKNVFNSGGTTTNDGGSSYGGEGQNTSAYDAAQDAAWNAPTQDAVPDGPANFDPASMAGIKEEWDKILAFFKIRKAETAAKKTLTGITVEDIITRIHQMDGRQHNINQVIYFGKTPKPMVVVNGQLKPLAWMDAIKLLKQMKQQGPLILDNVHSLAGVGAAHDIKFIGTVTVSGVPLKINKSVASYVTGTDFNGGVGWVPGAFKEYRQNVGCPPGGSINGWWTGKNKSIYVAEWDQAGRLNHWRVRRNADGTFKQWYQVVR